MTWRAALGGLAATIALAAHGEDASHPPGRRAAEASREPWAFAGSAYWNAPRGEDAFASGILAADRGPLHLEARANYEALHARSAYLGWTFSTGDLVRLEATSIAGGVWGSMRGPIVGVEAAAAWRAWDAYVEAEHVHPSGEPSYTYAWTELGWRPAATSAASCSSRTASSRSPHTGSSPGRRSRW